MAKLDVGLSRFTTVLLLMFFGVITSRAAAGDVDTSFPAVLAKVGTGHVYRSVIQPDGKIIITGEFAVVDIGFRRNIARINADGSLDTTFNPPPIVANTSETGAPISAVALQSDGKIVISGRFARGLIRLNSDGSLDTAFNNSSALENISTGFDLKVLPDGRIVFSGIRPFPLSYRMIVLNSDGSLNLEAPGRGDVIEVQADGKTVLFNSESISLYRLNADLTLDSTFTAVSTAGPTEIARQIFSIQIQADGKIVFGGSFVTLNGGSLAYLARANANGTVDTSFNSTVTGPNSAVHVVVVRTDGKILIGGGFSTYNGVSKPRVALLNSDGSLDTSFSVTVGVQARDLDVLPDGDIILSGVNATFPVVPQSPLARLNPEGSLDPAFDSPVGAAGVGYKVKVLPDSKILVGGDFTHANGILTRNLARFNSDGTLDTTFIQNAAIIRSVIDFDVYPDGKVLAVPLDVATRRLNADGTSDNGFSAGSSAAFTVKVQPDGKALAADYNGQIRRLNANGSVDGGFSAITAFGSGPGRPESLSLQPDGKVLVGGFFGTVNGVTRGGIARLNVNGTLDTTFNTPGGVGFGCCSNNGVEDIQVQSDGKILIAGDFNSVSFTNRNGVARLNADGSIDTSFAPLLGYWAETVKPQPDGKVLIGGEFVTVEGLVRNHYARLNADGSLDRGFIVGLGADGDVNSIDLQSDGKIVMAGAFSTIDGTGAPGIVRLLNASTVVGVRFDYDGDGKSDVSVFRPSENQWYILRSSDLGVTQSIFALAGDIPTPADFDGDGKTDFAIFRPSSGDWWYLSSLDGTQRFFHWGANGDIPRPSDFDGDGRADYIVFRASQNYWYRISTGDGEISNEAFGTTGDKPLVGDFDGDGRSDKAIFRPSIGDWYWHSSLNGSLRQVHWGAMGDVPTPADFNGDGITDLAIYRPNEGNWYVRYSDQSFTVTNFGLAEDKPVPADYDGDGSDDIAVFRPSTGIWYLMRSTAGFTATNWGLSSDIPTQNSFLP